MSPRKGRLHCRHCGRTLVESYDHTYATVDVPGGFKTEERRAPSGNYGYRGDNLFCSLRCAHSWACARIATDERKRA